MKIYNLNTNNNLSKTKLHLNLKKVNKFNNKVTTIGQYYDSLVSKYKLEKSKGNTKLLETFLFAIENIFFFPESNYCNNKNKSIIINYCNQYLKLNDENQLVDVKMPKNISKKFIENIELISQKSTKDKTSKPQRDKSKKILKKAYRPTMLAIMRNYNATVMSEMYYAIGQYLNETNEDLKYKYMDEDYIKALYTAMSEIYFNQSPSPFANEHNKNYLLDVCQDLRVKNNTLYGTVMAEDLRKDFIKKVDLMQMELNGEVEHNNDPYGETYKFTRENIKMYDPMGIEVLKMQGIPFERN